MAQIFLSWASSDTDIVTPLIERLRDLGLGAKDDLELPTLWEYQREMAPADVILARVKQAIRESDAAVMCLSDKALEHPWIISEATLVSEPRPDGRPRKIIPIQVGPTSPDSLKKIAHVIGFPQAYVADVSRGSETELIALGTAIFESVNLKLPKTVPIAVIAMIEQQAVDLFKDLRDKWKDEGQAFWELCRAVGMDSPPELLEAFRKRYGEHPEDLRPFKSCESGSDGPNDGAELNPEDDTVMDIIHESLRLVNATRVKREERPIFPRWIHGELFGPEGDDKFEAERLWSSHDSLLVIDQISLFKKEVLDQLASLPAASEAARTAALCLPPYTQHTRRLEEMLGVFANEFLDLRHLFEDWSNTERMISFDTPTSVTLRLWLHRRFDVVPDKDPPVKAKVKSMPPSRRAVPRQLRPQGRV